jgi:hypothetical protein
MTQSSDRMPITLNPLEQVTALIPSRGGNLAARRESTPQGGEQQLDRDEIRERARQRRPVCAELAAPGVLGELVRPVGALVAAGLTQVAGDGQAAAGETQDVAVVGRPVPRDESRCRRGLLPL